MSWYLAKIVYRIVCGEGRHTAQFDEQLRLIRAEKKEEALLKAQLLGSRGEEMFFNNDQQVVHWQFINISELYKLTELTDGAELYSRIEEREHAAAYIDIIHKKAAGIISSGTPEILQLV